MLRKFALIAIAAFFAARSAAAETSTTLLLNHALPVQATKVSDIGRGIGVVFSPDLSVPGNCNFYRALGFACFQDADWSKILSGIQIHNLLNPDRRMHTLVLETHGTNGNGLKVQTASEDDSPRSYVSVGALQERLEQAGVSYLVISACNSGRLLRPEIYNRLNPFCGDKLFKQATLGIVNASDDFDPRLSAVTIIRPQASYIETTIVAAVRELRPATRRALTAAARARGITLPKEFAVSDMLMQMLLRDRNLVLVTGAYTEDLSKDIRTQETSEEHFKRFLGHLNRIAAADPSGKAKKTLVAKKNAPRKPAKPASKSAAGASR